MKKYFLTTLFFISVVPILVRADEVRLTTDATSTALGDRVTVVAYLDSTSTRNAIEGRLAYPPSLDVVDIGDGNSSVNFWLEGPHQVASDTIAFAGITPGGFRKDNARLFSVTFSPKILGTSTISLNGVNVYASDGKGTMSSVASTSATIVGVSGVPKLVTSARDVDPPEDFTPVVFSDPAVYDGANFLVFSTTDKGSGMDHFEVREGLLALFRRVRSPYLLLRQKLDRPIYVRAFDKAGNIQEEVVAPRVVIPFWMQEEWVALFVALILLIELGNIIVHRKLHKKVRMHLSSRFHVIRDIEEAEVVLPEHHHEDTVPGPEEGEERT